MLATRATAEELRLLEQALGWLAENDPLTFGALFAVAPGAGRRVVPVPPAPVARPLWAFGLVEGDANGIAGKLRVRQVGARFYVMNLGLGEHEYLQDVWPETDALLAALDGAAPGRLCDLGTGSGVLAVEAAARGHSVVATDLFDTALILARFNARLNRLDGAIEFREGHLYQPVAGERFDLIVTNPHYGRVDDQLRLEVLRGAADQLAPGGRLVLATALEWEEGAPRRRLGVESALQPLAAAGFAVTVRPIDAAYKRDWFAVARGEVARLVSRHRFTIEVTRGAPGVDVRWPSVGEANRRTFVPWSRLTRGSFAALTSAADLERLAEVCRALDGGEARFENLPRGLLDACRVGERACVGERGAAGAILDGEGQVRPCTHGGAVARFDDTRAELVARLETLGAEAWARRGCAGCAAQPVCSRCLFPALVDEAAYCDFIRAHASRLGRLHRLFAIAARLDEARVPPGPLSLTRLDGAAEPWLVERSGERALFWNDGRLRPIDAATAAQPAALAALLSAIEGDAGAKR